MPRPGLPLTLLLLAGLLGGCALRMRATCPVEGGPTWRELTSAHFRLRTDMGRGAAEETLLQLERHRQALLLTWGEGFDPPGRVDVIALRHPSELAEFRGKDAVGFAVARAEGPLLVLTGDGGYLLGDSEPNRGVILHELAHYLSRHAMPRQPRWLAEGLATYLQTLYVRADGRTFTLGRVAPEWYRHVRSAYRLTLAQLWEWDEHPPPERELPRHYASSWLWVHYLLHHHEQRMADFQARLARLEEPRAAFDAAFAGVDWGHEQREVEALLRLGRLGSGELPMKPVQVRSVERTLEPAEVHALRVELGSHGTKDAQAYAALVRREVTAALREAPGSFHARLLEARTAMEPRQQLALARALVQRHPGRSEAWALLAGLLVSAPEAAREREAALTRGLQLAPDSPVLLNGLASEYVLRGELQRALPLARRAVQLAPWSPLYLGVYAAVLAGVGRCDQALVLQGQAVSALGEETPAAERQLYAQTLAGYAHCAAASVKD